MKPLSIKDIAKKANVSITTISFILNGKAREKRISEEVIKKVEAIIKEHGYKPNQIARSLRTGSTHIIGLIVEDISNPFFAVIARMIEDKAYKKGYKISYSSTDNNLDKAKDLIQMYKNRQVDAYIIVPVPGIEEEIQGLIDDGKPVVFFDRNLPDLKISYVGVDHFNGAYEATRHLIQNKKKNIAFVSVDLEVKQITDRFEGYQKALKDHHIKFNKNLCLILPFERQAEVNIERLQKFLEENPELDAILFATNYLAINGLMALKRMNKSIDETLSVISYDDHDLFSLHTPAITAVDQPVDLVAEKVIDLVLAELTATNPEKGTENIILPTKLIVR